MRSTVTSREQKATRALFTRLKHAPLAALAQGEKPARRSAPRTMGIISIKTCFRSRKPCSRISDACLPQVIAFPGANPLTEVHPIRPLAGLSEHQTGDRRTGGMWRLRAR